MDLSFEELSKAEGGPTPGVRATHPEIVKLRINSLFDQLGPRQKARQASASPHDQVGATAAVSKGGVKRETKSHADAAQTGSTEASTFAPATSATLPLPSEATSFESTRWREERLRQTRSGQLHTQAEFHGHFWLLCRGGTLA